MSDKRIKSKIESMLFVWGKPLDVKDIADVLGMDKSEVYNYCQELQAEYEQEERGILIREINKSFQFVSRAENIDCIERLCTPVKRKKLSSSALETLSIIAYKQPITKGEIEAVRGIRCDRVIESLIKRNLIMELGRANSIGRPVIYGTTDEFLKLFGFESIKELPDIENIEDVIT